MVKKQVVPECDVTDRDPVTVEIANATEQQVQTQDKPTLPTQVIEVQNGKYKSIDGCAPQDFFHAHLLAKDRAASHMRSAEFLLAAADYYKRLSGVQ
jgi:hypothetical protein